ncbi:MAG: hypothetical protein ACTSWQ_01015 [Candidatus Thorarchaeota archaeon]
MVEINDDLSNPFVLIKVGDYEETLSELMDRITREIELERLSDPKPWYPFAYRITPADYSVRYNLTKWGNQYGGLPKRIDLLFCADDSGQEDWPRFKKRVYSPEELLNDQELVQNRVDSWKKMEPSWRRDDKKVEMPDHYWVSLRNPSVKFYALIIEELELREQMVELDLTRCITFPGEKQIPKQFQGLVCTKSAIPVSTTYRTAWVVGKANLIEPYAVRLLPP